jgi:catechol 2,3-dioxygenase-like lactoylglutathione lyase family enzyme
LYVGDLDQSAHFYARIFGFEVMLHDDRIPAEVLPSCPAVMFAFPSDYNM